jgi:hypothetical protein
MSVSEDDAVNDDETYLVDLVTDVVGGVLDGLHCD